MTALDKVTLPAKERHFPLQPNSFDLTLSISRIDYHGALEVDQEEALQDIYPSKKFHQT
jgi:hypothetical protein